eukprot:1906148-Rhodomonas_salina.1
MELYHWDIQGAFMTSTLDTEIFMDLPPGALFHNTLEAWLLEYGSTTVGADGVIFKLKQGGESMMLSLYVDDG